MRSATLAAAGALLALAVLAPTASATHAPLPQSPAFDEVFYPCDPLPVWDHAFCAEQFALDQSGPWVAWGVAVAAWGIDEAEHQGDYVRCDVVGGPACATPVILRAITQIIEEALEPTEAD